MTYKLSKIQNLGDYAKDSVEISGWVDAIRDLKNLNKKYDIRVTGSDLLKYDSIKKLIKYCNQNYLLGDYSNIIHQV